MSLLEWKPAYELGFALMDDTHREFADLVNALGAAPDEQVLAAYDALLEHTIAHFAQENHWMAACRFPPIDCHVGEHHRVVAAMQSVRKLVARGDVAIGRRAAEEMVPWFANHAATMDTALSVHMRNSGYQPQALAGEAKAA